MSEDKQTDTNNSNSPPNYISVTCHKWWDSLQQKKDDNGKVHRGDPGALARLRRAAKPVDAIYEEQTIRLAQMLDRNKSDERFLSRVGVIAGVLAYAKDHEQSSKQIAARLGPQKKDEPALMSSLRFHRLMAAKSDEELMAEMRNVARFLKGALDIYQLSDAIYYWNDATRIHWIYNYWGEGSAAPPGHKSSREDKVPSADSQNT